MRLVLVAAVLLQIGHSVPLNNCSCSESSPPVASKQIAPNSFQVRLYDALVNQTVVMGAIEKNMIRFDHRIFMWKPSDVHIRGDDLDHFCAQRFDPSVIRTGDFNELVPEIHFVCDADQNCCEFGCCAQANGFIRSMRWLLLLVVIFMVGVTIEEAIRLWYRCLIDSRARVHIRKRSRINLRRKFELELVEAPARADPLFRKTSSMRLSTDDSARRLVTSSASTPLISSPVFMASNKSPPLTPSTYAHIDETTDSGPSTSTEGRKVREAS